MLTQHVLIAAVLLGVLRRASEDLGPPGSDVAPVLFMHAAREEWREQLILLDPVVERVDHRVERLASACPLIQRRMIGHRVNVPRGSQRKAGDHETRARQAQVHGRGGLKRRPPSARVHADVVGLGERVQIPFRSGDASVAKPVLDHLKLSATRQQP